VVHPGRDLIGRVEPGGRVDQARARAVRVVQDVQELAYAERRDVGPVDEGGADVHLVVTGVHRGLVALLLVEVRRGDFRAALVHDADGELGHVAELRGAPEPQVVDRLGERVDVATSDVEVRRGLHDLGTHERLPLAEEEVDLGAAVAGVLDIGLGDVVVAGRVDRSHASAARLLELQRVDEAAVALDQESVRPGTLAQEVRRIAVEQVEGEAASTLLRGRLRDREPDLVHGERVVVAVERVGPQCVVSD
jgi:hypothetical protein